MSVTLATIHDLIRRGQGRLAATELRRKLKARAPRAELAELARLSYRVGYPEGGLRLLHPIVRPPPNRPTVATDEENAEYAHCLVKHGAVEEAELLLRDVSPKRYPAALFYRASALISQWRYAESISLIEAYLKVERDPYKTLVAQVNLAGAFIFEGQARKAAPLLRSLTHEAALRGYGLMLGRVLELSAENFILQKKWAEARRFLASAGERLKDSGGFDASLVRTYAALVDLQEAPESEGARRRVREAREAAREAGHVETVRNCDRALAATGDRKARQFVYFGTPYGSFREKIEGDLPESYVWDVSRRGTGDGVLDLPRIFPVGSLPYRLVAAIVADFYRAPNLATLHARLYPERHFHPVHSPPRVHNVIKRAREIFSENKMPFEIIERGGRYHLQTARAFGVRVGREAAPLSRREPLLDKLREKLGLAPFTMADALGVLEVPRRTALRLLAAATDDGMLTRTGRTSTVRYAFRK